jgi:hypothetical protein
MKLSEVHVVVEITFHVVRVFKILGGIFHHFQNGKGQIQENNLLTIYMSLANWKIKKNPLHSPDWSSSNFHEMLELFCSLLTKQRNAF